MNFQDLCSDVTAKLSQIKIVPVLVLNDLDSGLKMCELLAECGLPAAEITFRTTAAESIIKEYRLLWFEIRIKIVIHMDSINLIIVNNFTNTFCDQVPDNGPGRIIIQGSVKSKYPSSDLFIL